MWPTRKTPQPQHQKVQEEKAEDDYDVERCLKLVMMDFNPAINESPETMKLTQVISPVRKKIKDKAKSSLNIPGQKHSKRHFKLLRR